MKNPYYKILAKKQDILQESTNYRHRWEYHHNIPEILKLTSKYQ